MSILNYCSNKGIRIITIKDNFNLSDDINSKIIAFAFALASEIERNLISQRTKEALAVKKLSGIKLGRPSRMTPKVRKLSDEIELVRARIETGQTKSSIAREYGVHRNTLDKCLRSGNDVIFKKKLKNPIRDFLSKADFILLIIK